MTFNKRKTVERLISAVRRENNVTPLDAALETCTFIHLADAFIQSDLQLRNTISDTLYRGKQSEEEIVIQNFRHCSEQILARQGEDTERE